MSSQPQTTTTQLNIKQQQALLTLSKLLGPTLQQKKPLGLVDFAHKNYCIPETQAPIHLLPHQQSILGYMFDPENDFQNLVYSTVKKSGKTAIAGLVARWVAETWGPRSEVYCVANDLEQARGRIYSAAISSIELSPGYDRVRRVLGDRWKIIERHSVHLPSNSILKAVSSDYKGEAGSNPTATFWSELWGYASEASRRLWDELTPVPTRRRSIRFVETYAGFEDESDLLIELYRQAVEQGKRLTHDDIDWPFPDQPPIYVNKTARLCAYWDVGEVARRMPWQTPQYYAAQEATLRPMAFRRLHLNEWTSSVSTFIPIEWWDGCATEVPPLDSRTPMVLGVDAAVSSDCCAISGVTRHWDPARPRDLAIRLGRIWYPPKGGTINLDETINATLRALCKEFNVVQVAYDSYQLHNIMTNMRTDAVAWCKPFSQSSDRALADKQLYDVIRDRKIAHNGDPMYRDHIKNAAAKQAKDEDTKLRIIKKTKDAKIDFAVATSMAAYECLRLNL